MPKWLFHPITLLLTTILVIWLYMSLLHTEEKMRMSTESVLLLDQEVAEIASQVSLLENRLAQANSEQSKEQRIRDELLLQKPGEYVIQLPTQQVSAETIEDDVQESPLQSWLQLIN
jgi:hypothetical protein